MRTTDAHAVTGFSPDEVLPVAAVGRLAENNQSTTMHDRQISCHAHRVLLERIAARLCALHGTDSVAPFQAGFPIRSYAQPDQAAP